MGGEPHRGLTLLLSPRPPPSHCPPLDFTEQWDKCFLPLLELNCDQLVEYVITYFFNSEFLKNADTAQKEKMRVFVSRIASSYNSKNHYHCIRHACHVFTSASVLFSYLKERSIFSEIEELAFLFAAFIHDVDHLGVPNAKLCSDLHPYAIRYSDRSVAEMRSLELAFELLQLSECNFLSHIDNSLFKEFRKIVITLVLSTDIADPKQRESSKALVENVGFFRKDG